MQPVDVIYNISGTECVEMLKYLNRFIDKIHLTDKNSIEVYNNCRSLKGSIKQQICPKLIKCYNTRLQELQSDKVRAEDILRNPDLQMFAEVKSTMNDRIQKINASMNEIKENVSRLLNLLGEDEDRTPKDIKTDATINVSYSPVVEQKDDNKSVQEKPTVQTYTYNNNAAKATVQFYDKNDENASVHSTHVKIEGKDADSIEDIVEQCRKSMNEHHMEQMKDYYKKKSNKKPAFDIDMFTNTGAFEHWSISIPARKNNHDVSKCGCKSCVSERKIKNNMDKCVIEMKDVNKSMNGKITAEKIEEIIRKYFKINIDHGVDYILGMFLNDYFMERFTSLKDPTDANNTATQKFLTEMCNLMSSALYEAIRRTFSFERGFYHELLDIVGGIILSNAMHKLYGMMQEM